MPEDITPAHRGKPKKVGPPTVFHAHLPETLDFDAVLSEETRKWKHYAAWIVSAVVLRRFVLEGVDENTFVPLGSEFVELFVPANARKGIIADLEESGVLECDHLKLFGPLRRNGKGKSFCYRLGAAYRGIELQQRQIQHPELIKKMATYWRNERDEIKHPTHRALRAWHDIVEVLDTAPHKEHLLLDAILKGERRFTVDPMGRVHTNVANLPAQYRQFIRLGGRELTSIDISTSQPLILAIFLTNQGIRERVAREHKTTVTFTLYSDASLNVYLADCLAGTVYDRIVAQTGLSRDIVKQKFMAVVYGEPCDMDTRVGRAIKSLYPGVYDAVMDASYRLGSGGLARLMQRIESRVMIMRVAGRLVRERPDVPVLTVHDSILVPPEHGTWAETVIREEWRDEFGFEPVVKRSAFTAPQAARPKQKKKSSWKRPGWGKSERSRLHRMRFEASR